MIGSLNISGQFEQVYEAIYNVHETNDSASFKDQFKLLCSILIDDIWSKPKQENPEREKSPPREANIRLETQDFPKFNLPLQKINQESEKPTMYNR